MVKPQVVINVDELKRLREENNYSISDLADELGYKTPTGYWLIEQDQRRVSIDTLYRLAKLYDCSMENLLKENPDYDPVRDR